VPGGAGGGGHLLVVVAGRAAGREGVVEPEAVPARDGVGEVGERRRALVGGDDEIGIVVVMAHDVVGRDNLLVGKIVGDVEQGGDEQLVGVGALGLRRLARAALEQ